MGYLRPVRYWNDGKKEEFKERKVYDTEKALAYSEKGVEKNGK